MHLEDVLSGALEGLQLPFIDCALRAAADQVRIIVRPPQAPHLAIVAPVQYISYDMQAHACKILAHLQGEGHHWPVHGFCCLNAHHPESGYRTQYTGRGVPEGASELAGVCVVHCNAVVAGCCKEVPTIAEAAVTACLHLKFCQLPAGSICVSSAQHMALMSLHTSKPATMSSRWRQSINRSVLNVTPEQL